jgi:hypothetical protein
MGSKFSSNDFKAQEVLRIAGSVQRFQRVPVTPITAFQPNWRCLWCAVPTWPVVLDTGAFYDCEVDEDLEGAFADATRPHRCRGGVGQ